MLATPEQLEALAKIFRAGRKLQYDKDEFIIRPGEEETPGVFYIEKGLVKSFVLTKYGEENVLIIRKAGEIFPLVWVIIGQRRKILYQALEPTTVWRIDKQTCLDALENQPELIPPVLDMVTDFYRYHAERIINLSYRSVRERLVSFLITMANRFGRETPEGIEIAVALRHKEIASAISATRETVTREIEILEHKDLIFNDHSKTVIKDLEALKGFLE